MADWVLMTKGEEEKLVHPGNVDNHIRAGWQLKVAADETVVVETHAELQVQPEAEETVAVETHAELQVQPEAEETVAVETHAESDVDEPIEADS